MKHRDLLEMGKYSRGTTNEKGFSLTMLYPYGTSVLDEEEAAAGAAADLAPAAVECCCCCCDNLEEAADDDAAEVGLAFDTRGFEEE